MELYFLRHGEADWPDWHKSDDERPLTKRGKKEMHEVAAFLVRLKVRTSLILTSPLPRAAQTAEIAAEHLKLKCREDRQGLVTSHQLQNRSARETAAEASVRYRRRIDCLSGSRGLFMRNSSQPCR